MEDKVDNPSPQSTLQVLPSFEVYTPPVTHLEEVEETIEIPMEVEPLNETKLEEVKGLKTVQKRELSGSNWSSLIITQNQDEVIQYWAFDDEFSEKNNDNETHVIQEVIVNLYVMPRPNFWNDSKGYIVREVYHLKQKRIDLLPYCTKKVGNGVDTLFWDEAWLGDVTLKHIYPRVYALETNKLISVAEKLEHQSVIFSLRREPRGAAEHGQEIELSSRIADVVLSQMQDRWGGDRYGLMNSGSGDLQRNRDNVWVVDSGCTEYITHQLNLLMNLIRTSNEAPVVIPNGSAIPVMGRGEFSLPGGAKINRGLRTRNLIGAGRCQGGLYLMDMSNISRRTMMTTLDTWHKRLGHASKKKLLNVDFLKNNSIKSSNALCDSCAKAKHARTPFPISFIKTTGCFELIHCDIWGGYRIPSYIRANFFLTIVDDYSRAVWVFLIKHKSDASQCLMNFHKYVEVQFGKPIKRVRCDNDDRKIIVSRDVSFMENVFPFKNIIEGYCDNDDDPTKIQNETPHDISDTPKILNEEDSVQAQQENGFDLGTINQQGDDDVVEETFGSNLDLGPEGHDEPADTQNEPQRRSKRMKSQPTHFNDYVIKLPPSVDHSQPDSNQASSMGKQAIDSKWVYKTKYMSNGEVERYKARLVARGHKQREGVDYHETFAPVAKLVTVRTLLTIATKKNWIIHQLDVNNEFLHGDLDEEVYMKIPQGFSRDGETRVDHSLFTYQVDGVYVVILIYVDDVIIVGNNTKKIQQTKKELDKEFNIKNLGPLKYFLGIEVAKTSDGLVLSQRKYTLDILKDSGMLGCRPSAFPFEQGTKLDKGEEEARVDATRYRRLVGRLLYLQATRPDITYVVNILSQFVSDPRQNHFESANRVLRYLKGMPGQGILLPREGPPVLTAYCDSDWLGCPFTRRSRTGYLLLLGGGPISWKTKKQSVVSRSSTEAEYRAMASTVSEILWVRWLLKDLQVHIFTPTQLFCDNQTARHIANNPVYHERTKHVEMDCYFVRERVDTKEIVPVAIESKMQLADLLTKGLGSEQLHFLLNKTGIKDLHAPS
ncbi:putative RNA-directed DNA polymerase, partial [Tanacetum coccineum]